MSATKTPKALLLIAILALAGAVLVAGCGGAGGTTTANQNPPVNPPSAPVEPKKEAGAEEEATSSEAESEEGAKEEGAEEGTEGETAGGAEAEGTEGGESESPEGGGEAGAEGEAAAGAETAGGSGEGEEIFTSNCGSCHTLAAAGTSGVVGPNLDELMPSESTVEMQVINGGGAMPAFGKEGLLEEGEVKAVAEYVSSVAGE